MTKQELCDILHTTKSQIETNFPLLCKKWLEKGYLITKEGRGDSAVYSITKTEPQVLEKSVFSSRPAEQSEDLPNEKWVTCCISPAYEVSNQGRVRWKDSKILLRGSVNKQGYCRISFHNVQYQLHRIILQSFDPRDDWEDLAVDHINGKRLDNRLENLRWVTDEENTSLMKMNRLGLNQEITRLINKYGYKRAVELLRSL